MSKPQIRKVVQLPKLRPALPRRTPTGFRITNIKSIKPADPALIKKQEEEKLREQLHKEIEWRSRTCGHKTYECTLPVLCGREYCARHILEDPTAPYKQCAHTYSNGKQCPLPAPALQQTDNRRDQGLCFEHARAALASRQRNAAPPPPVTTPESLLNQLQHYVRPERIRTTSCASTVSVVSEPTDQEPNITPVVDPFKQIDATTLNASVIASLMECASGTDSDADSVTLGNGGSCRGGYDEDSSADEDTAYDLHPLRFAGIFTAEEAVGEAKTALKMLQSSYIRQMGRLKVLLQHARWQYLRSLRAEREQYSSINAQAQSAPLTIRERRQLRKLKAYASYRKKHGMDAVLARKLYHKRAKLLEANAGSKPGPQGKCIFTEGGVRCSNRFLPASKYCLKHILNDRHQVLFEACSDSRGGVTCQEPIPKLPVATIACRYHTDPPPYTIFTLKKEDTDSDSELNTVTDVESQVDDLDQSIEDKTDAVEIPAEKLEYTAE